MASCTTSSRMVTADRDGRPGQSAQDGRWLEARVVHPLAAATPRRGRQISNVKVGSSAHYVGSHACEACHADEYRRWKKTPMANIVRDPAQSPPTLFPDLTTNTVFPFKPQQVAFVYGRSGSSATSQGRRRLLPARRRSGTCTHKMWRPYFVQPNTDWWVPHYPADKMQRPTGPLCDGCHSVNYDIQTKTVTEWNVGCEKCHGPGSEHVRAAGRRQHRESREARRRARQRRVHPVSLAGPAAGRIRSRGSTTTGRSGFNRATAEGLLEARGAQARGDDVHAFARRHRAQEPDAGQRLRPEPDVSARRHVLRLPRRPRHRQRRAARQAGAATLCLTATAPSSPNGPHARASRRTRTTKPTARAASASPATCRRSNRPLPTSTSAATRSSSSLRR